MNTLATQNDIKNRMDANDIKLIWQHLEKTFGLDVKIYQANFQKYLVSNTGDANVAECFITFGAGSIEPVLNEMLMRNQDYPTWNNLLRFFLKDKLAENSEQLNYYRSGAWKSMKMDDTDHARVTNHFVLL